MGKFLIGDTVFVTKGTGTAKFRQEGKVLGAYGPWLQVSGVYCQKSINNTGERYYQPVHEDRATLVRPVKQDGNPRALLPTGAGGTYENVPKLAVFDDDGGSLETTAAEARPYVEKDPSGLSASTPGAKLDAGKPQPLLIMQDMARAIAAVVQIATDGAVKYTEGGWLMVKDGPRRYDNAAHRHRSARLRGEHTDPQSGHLHLAHEAWNALAILELALRAEEEVA